MIGVATAISRTPTKEGKRTSFQDIELMEAAKILGFTSKKSAAQYIARGEANRRHIADGDEKEYEWEVCDKERTQYKDGEVKKL